MYLYKVNSKEHGFCCCMFSTKIFTSLVNRVAGVGTESLLTGSDVSIVYNSF